MNDKQILEFCLRHKITVSQYFIIYLTNQRWQGFTYQFNEYVKLHPWSQDELKDLMKKKLIVSTSHRDSEEIHFTEIRVSDSFGEETLAHLDLFEQLWLAYPVTFNLSGGGTFIARTGMNKDKLAVLYLNKIGHDPGKHTRVLSLLAKYCRLVMAGKINGHKLSDWVDREMWETVAEIPDDVTASKFKDDI